MIFQESDLQFYFDDSQWQVIKYDTHKYYKTLSGSGLKGVDFIGIRQENQLVFFEIKNFRNYQSTAATKYTLFKDTDHFIQQIQDKMEDTLTAIKVISKYLKRKSWYRFFLRIEPFIPNRLIKSKDWYFWHQISNLRNSSTSKTFLLWIEIDPNFKSKTSESFLEALQKKLIKAFENFDITPVLTNLKNPVYLEDLVVKKGT